MRFFWFDPYLWVHLAGLAALPLFLEGCLLGFAVGDPILPVWAELLLVAVVGSAPILWMQWQRPFYIFSLVAVTVKPEKLTDDQKRLLVLFKSQRNRVVAAVVPALLVILLWKIYELAPIATPVVAFLPEWHWLGLLLAAVAFLACNLFAQVPASVASVMATSESAFAATPPHRLESIRRSFTLLGLQLNQLLPPIRPEVKPASVDPAVPTVPIAPIPAIPIADPLTDDLLTNDVWVEAAPPTIASATSDSATTDSDTKPSPASDGERHEPDLSDVP